MVNAEHLSKAYDQVQALRDVTFHIAEGEIVGLLGHNGAGKTTIIKTLTGYLQPDSGTVEIDNLNVLTETQQVQALIGYLPENAPLYPELTVQAYLQMVAELRQIPAEQQMRYLSDAIYATGLEQHLLRPIRQLSKGFRQRVGLAQAILHKPKLLILDEPTVGLDPTQIVEIRNLIRQLSQHSTILFSTHILSEVEALCDRVIILSNGQIRADAQLDQLVKKNETVLTLTHSVIDGADKLRSLAGVQAVRQEMGKDGRVVYHISAETDLNHAIFTLAATQQWPVHELRSDTQTLETIFRDLQTKPLAAEPTDEETAEVVPAEQGDER